MRAAQPSFAPLEFGQPPDPVPRADELGQPAQKRKEKQAEAETKERLKRTKESGQRGPLRLI